VVPLSTPPNIGVKRAPVKMLRKKYRERSVTAVKQAFTIAITTNMVDRREV
jgi:hypothetical protein